MTQTLVSMLTDVTLREGSQQFSDFRGCQVSEKLELFRRIKATGVKSLELTAFAPGAWFQDADELSMGVADNAAGLDIYALYFNAKGAERLLSYPHLVRHGIIHSAVTPEYRIKNYNQRSLQDAKEKAATLLSFFSSQNLPFDTFVVSTVFGSRETGLLPVGQTIQFLEEMIAGFATVAAPPRRITLADTEGIVSGEHLALALKEIRRALPNQELIVHLHPRHEVAEQLVRVSLENEVSRFEGAWLGVGGSPFAEGAGGNLDIRVLIEVFQKEGLESGLTDSAIEPLLEYLGSIRRNSARESR